MLTRRLKSSSRSARGPVILALAALFGVAGATTASPTTIFQDNFSGSSSAELNGTAPSTGPTGVTWTAASSWMADGSQTSNVTGNANAYLPYVVTSGNIYTLSAGLDPTNTSSGWFGLGFITNTPSTGVNYWFAGSGGGYFNSGPWLLVGESSTGPGGKFNPGPGYTGTNGGASGGYTSFATTNAVQDVSIVLNTGSSQWTYQVFDNNLAVAPVQTLAVNPDIVGVAIGANGGPMPTGKVSDFSLTASPVPEPTAVGLLAVGGAALLLFRRRGAACRRPA